MISMIEWVVECPKCGGPLFEAPKGSGDLACPICGFMTHYLDEDKMMEVNQ